MPSRITRKTTPARPAAGWQKVGLPVLIAALCMLIVSAVMAAPLTAPASTFTLTPNPAWTTAVSPDGLLEYGVVFRNTSSSETFAAGGTLTVTLPEQVIFQFASAGYSLGANNTVIWQTAELAPNATMNFSVTARVPATQVVAKDRLTFQVGAEVEVVGGGNHTNSTSNFHSVVGPTFSKVVETSVTEAGNSATQAVAGELVTLTASYTFPQGTVAHSFSPRLNMQDGLLPNQSIPDGAAVNTGALAALQAVDPSAGLAGALVVFPPTDVTNTDAGPQTVVFKAVAYRTRDRYVPPISALTNGTVLNSRVGARWCAGSGCSINPTGTTYTVWDAANGVPVTAVQPALTLTYEAPTYLDDKAVGAGGGNVTVPIKMANTNGRPPAHDRVLTVPVPAGFQFISASDGGAESSGTVTWNLPAGLAGGANQTVNMTVKLPASFQVGTQYPLTGAGVAYDTFAGVVTEEGVYTSTAANSTLQPGISVVTKTSNPASGAVTMGDSVSYTVTFHQGANTSLLGPYVVDTLPLGFRYVEGSLNVTGASVTGVTLSEGPATTSRYHTNLRWNLADSTTGAAGLTVTATFSTLNNGLDYRNAPVYDSKADLAAAKNSMLTNTTGSILNWTAPVGSTYNKTARANSTQVTVAQPMLNNDQFSSARNGSTSLEIGQSANLLLRFRNSAPVTGVNANELQVCDTLPAGFVYNQTFSCSAVGFAGSCPSYTEPPADSTGKVCWSFASLPRTDTAGKYYELSYQVTASASTQPGAHTSRASVGGYSSKPGAVEGEREFAGFPNALPAPANCGAGCLPVLGLRGQKTAVQPSVAPGDQITYLLSYEDTSLTTSYTGVVIEDVYDPLLTFVSASPAPTSHDQANRKLTWNIGSLENNTGGQIEVTFTVAPEVSGFFKVWNTMYWDSAQSEKHQITNQTPLQVGSLSFEFLGPDTAHAAQELSFSVVYSNTGTSELQATLNMNYGPYVSYLSSDPPADNPQGTIFSLSVPNDGVERTATLNLKVNAPLPYTLDEVTLGLTLEALGIPDQTASRAFTLLRPRLVFKKIGPSIAAAPGNQMTYNFTLTNEGDFTATNLVVTDIFDAATSFASPGTLWTLAGDGRSATFPIASLAPGDSAVITPLAVRVDATKDRYENRAKVWSFQTSVQEDSVWTWAHILHLTLKADQDPAFPGRTLKYTVEYKNTDPNIGIGNASVTVQLPAGLAYEGESRSAASGCDSGWSFNLSGQSAVWSCSYLSGNAGGSFEIWGKANAAENTYLSISGSSSGAHPVAAWELSEPMLTQVARPWLRVNASGQPTHPVAPGNSLTYTFTYENYGSDPARSVVVKNQLPTDKVTFVSCTSGCSQSGGLVTWNVGEVNKGSSGSVSVTVSVKPGTENQTIVNGSYSIQSERLAAAETEKGAAVETSVLAPQLGLAMSASKSAVSGPGDEVTFTVSASNNGGGTLTGVVVTHELSLFTIFRSASGGCVHDGASIGGVVTCDLGQLNQGQTKTASFVVGIGTGLAAKDVLSLYAAGVSAQTALVTSNAAQVCYQSCPVEQNEFKLFLPVVRR